MRTIPIALANHLAGATTSLANIWTITRTDGFVLRFVALDRSVVVDGQVYDAMGAFNATAVQNSSGMSVDNLEIQGILDSPSITEADLIGGRYDHAAVELATINWRSPSDGKMVVSRGYIGKTTVTRLGWTAEIRAQMQLLQQRQGRMFQVGCDANLGDKRCGVNIASYTFAGTLQVAGGGTAFASSSFADKPDHYFQGGLVKFTSGANAGFEIEVRDYVSGTFTLQDSAPNAWAAGDTFVAIAGCDKWIQTCAKKFGNQLNHRGFPLIPGMDRWQAGK